MQQTAFSWDSVTIQKTVKGFIISLLGAFLAGFVLLVPEVTEFLSKNDPIAWTNILVAAWGAFSSGLINAVKQFLTGIEK